MKAFFHLVIICIAFILCGNSYAADGEKLKTDFIKDSDEWNWVYNTSQTSKGRGASVFLNNDKLTKERMSSFNLSIKNNGLSGEIVVCKKSVDIPVGRINTNISHGGVCLYQDKGKYTPVYICNDEMVGHFEMVPIEGALNQFDGSIGRISEFTLNHCFGG